MNFLRKQLDKIKPNFDKGGKFEKYAPAFNGIDTFLFVPNHTTKHGAHIRDGIDLKRVMITVVIAVCTDVANTSPERIQTESESVENSRRRHGSGKHGDDAELDPTYTDGNTDRSHYSV